MAHSNADILAAWLIHAHRTDPSCSLFPTNEEIEQLLRDKPGRWMEASAVAEAFCRQVLETNEPKTIADTGKAALKFVKGIQNILPDGFLSAAPVAPKR